MVTLQTAENALKEVYLGVVANQLNVGTSPLYAKIRQSSKDIFGKEIVKAAPYGLNGGFGAGGEADPLPHAAGNNYAKLRSTLKNLYGRVEISDKAIRASSSNVGSFVNLLADEMENLVKACSYNLNRMLYGNGDGLVATITAIDGVNNIYTCDSVSKIMEGMMVNIYTGEQIMDDNPIRVLTVDRVNKTITVDLSTYPHGGLGKGNKLYVQGSKNNELTGLDAIFTKDTLYGLNKSDYPWLNPYKDDETSEISDIRIQTGIDFLEENADSQVNFIATSRAVRRAYQQYLNIYRKNVDVVDIGNGFKTITHNGIPVYADKFIDDGTMYLLNTDDFILHQLADWRWIEDEAGRVIRQNPGYPTFSATLVKYAELMCDKPFGQGKLSNIKFTVDDPYKTYIPSV